MLEQDPHPIVTWELTRACDLHCTSCPIAATEKHGLNELTTYETYKTVDQIAMLAPRELVITGGDPLERSDIFQIVDYARRRGLAPVIALNATSTLSAEAVTHLAQAGAKRVVLRLDGFTPEMHRVVQGAAGTFATTFRAMSWAEKAGIGVEVNTLITRRNADHLPAIAALLRPAGIERWNLYVLVPTTVAEQAEMLLAGEIERLFGIIDEIRGREAFAIRLVEAPQYRRFRLQRDMAVQLDNAEGLWPDFSGYEQTDTASANDIAACATSAAHDSLFISHCGDVRASEFLSFSAGNLRYRPLGAIYRSSDLFVALRDPENLKGKCGRCDFRHVCGGGSRARAWAIAGNLFADDPLCTYEPGAALPLPLANVRQPEASS